MYANVHPFANGNGEALSIFVSNDFWLGFGLFDDALDDVVRP